MTSGGKINATIAALTEVLRELNFNVTPEMQAQIDKAPQLKELFNSLKSAFTTFRDRAPGHLRTCMNQVRYYVTGAMCSVCRPDFTAKVPYFMIRLKNRTFMTTYVI